jgi:uncharacterized protein (TIGR02265 family)
VKERIVFEHTMESLLRVLGSPLPPEQSAELASLGVDVGRPLMPAYPLTTYVAVMDYIARRRWPELSEEDAGQELGRAFMRAYRQTLLGKAVYALTRLIGPHRTLDRITRNFRTANNFTETQLERVGPATYVLRFSYVTRVGYLQGLLTEALEGTGARGLVVNLLASGEDGATFRITWTE